MQSLALPRPTSLRFKPSGHPSEPEDALARFRSEFSPGRPDQHSYPSPPMSEPHSPTRRTAQTSEPLRHSYALPASAPQRLEASLPLPPASSSLFDPRSVLSASNNPHPRPLYSGEQQARGAPLQYQPSRAIEQSSYSNLQHPQSFAYGYPSNGVPQYAGGHHGGPMAQQTALIAPPPSRPSKPARRTKAHVASACVNCKKAHLSCDVQRPCGRCVASGKQDSCKDVQHKKRGRPRLRDDRDFSTRPEDGRQQPGLMVGATPASIPESFAHQAPFPVSHSNRASDPVRMMDIPHMNPQSIPSSTGSQIGALGGVSASPYPAGPNSAYQTMPVAFLNLDLMVQKSNQVFRELFDFLGDVRGQHLGDLLEPRQNESLQRLRNELRDERNEREPAYMAPITPVGHDPLRPVLESLVDRDVDRVSHGFTDRPMHLSFRLRDGQFQSVQVRVRLAKTSMYFVTLVVLLPPRPSGPPLLTQQLAPPTPLRTSQTMSAPTTAPVRDFTPHHVRPLSATSSAPSSPYFNFSAVRTSLPGFSPSSYNSSPLYGYSPTAGPESGYFSTIQPPSQPGAAYPSPYAQAPSRNPSITSEPLHAANRPARLEGLQLPPIRTGPAPLGSPLHLESSASASAGATERELIRRRVSSPNNDERRHETPETGSKRRRLGIHEVLE